MPGGCPGSKYSLSDRLSEGEKTVVASMLSRFISAREIQRHVKDEMGKTLTLAAIYSYTQNGIWGPLIAKYRAKWKADLEEIPLYNKKVRLVQIQKLWDDVEKEINGDKKNLPGKRAELISLLREAREEAEKYKGGDTTNILAIQFANMSDEELLRRKSEVLNSLLTLGESNGKRMAAQQGTQEVGDGRNGNLGETDRDGPSRL